MTAHNVCYFFALAALLHYSAPVSSLSTGRISVISRKSTIINHLGRKSSILKAEKDDEDDDDLSNNFLNFLKKNKSDEIAQGNTEEDDEADEATKIEDENGGTVEKKNPNLFKEIISGNF